MKTLKLSIALAMSFASFLFASEYLGNTIKNIDSQVPSVSAFESMDSIVADDMFLAYSFIADTANADGGDDDTKACDDPMDDLCEGNYKPYKKDIRGTISQFESMDSIVADDAFLINTIIAGTVNVDGGDDDTVDCNDPEDDLCDGV